MTQTELNEVLKQHKLWLDTKGEEGKRADLRNSDLRYVNLRDADLTGANLTGADLSGAILNKAILRNADLRGVILKDAYLSCVYLSDANLEGIGVYFFDGPEDVGIYNSKDDKLYIGCQIHRLEYWLKNYVAIGKKHGYNVKEIEIYGNWIKSLKEAPK